MKFCHASYCQNLIHVNFLKTLPDTINIRDRSVTVTAVCTETAYESDLAALLTVISRGEIRINPRNRRLTSAAIIRISDVLTETSLEAVLGNSPAGEQPEFTEAAAIRPMTWFLLLKSARFIRFDGSVVNLTRTGQQALDRPPVEISGQLWRKWVASEHYNALRRVDVLRGQTSMKRPLAVAAPRRRLIAAALATLPPGKWVTVRDFYEYIQSSEYAFDIVRNPRGLYFLRRDFGMLSNTPATVNLLNETFMRIIIMEIAATAGIADLALIPPWGTRDLSDFYGISHWTCLSPFDGLYGFRITNRGAAILNHHEHPETREQDPVTFIVQANYEIHTGEISFSPRTRARLDRIASKVSDHTWRISERSILDAVEKGDSPEAIREFLELAHPGDLPDTVKALLDDVKRRINRLEDRGLVRLIAVSDPALKAQILNHPKLKRRCIDPGGEFVAVPVRHEKTFRAVLKAEGIILR